MKSQIINATNVESFSHGLNYKQRSTLKNKLENNPESKNKHSTPNSRNPYCRPASAKNIQPQANNSSATKTTSIAIGNSSGTK